MTRVLRLAACAIALAGLIDPGIALSSVSRARVAIVEAAAPSPVRDQLTRDLSSSFEIVSTVTSDAAAAIVIGDRYPDDRVPDGMLVATVTMPPPAMSGAHIVRVDAPRDVPAATTIHLGVEVEASGMVGQTTAIAATIDGLEAGSASHVWLAGESRWRAAIDAVPIGEPPYVLRVAVKGDAAGSEKTRPASNGGSERTRPAPESVDVVVDVRRVPVRVEFYDPRPSWATTFLRRALESDTRVQVAALTSTSRGVSAQAGGTVPLADPRLDAFDAVIVGGLDKLTAAEAQALDRFMRERGGAVVLVPDQRIDAGPARDLVAGRTRAQPEIAERLLEQPATLAVAPPAAALRASEILVMRAPPPGADVIARLPGAEAAPVIVSLPRGDGRLVISGAMDAWRFRGAGNGAFDRFWQSTITGLAAAVPPPITIDVDPPLLRPGENGDVIVRVRSRGAAGIGAVVDGQPIRLLPAAEAGVYRGRFTARSTEGRSIVQVDAASRSVIVRPDVMRVTPAGGPSLAMLASSHRGIDVTPDRLPELERFVRAAVAAPLTRETRHPMRSTWWIVPFAGCLSAEWWLRRRRGQR